MTSLRSILTLFFDWCTVQVLATGAGRLGGIQYHRPRFRDDFLSERAVTDERDLFEHGKKVYAAVLATSTALIVLAVSLFSPCLSPISYSNFT